MFWHGQVQFAEHAGMAAGFSTVRSCLSEVVELWPRDLEDQESLAKLSHQQVYSSDSQGQGAGHAKPMDHDFGSGISKVLRLPRFRAPRAARATTSHPFRQLPNAAPATQTHAQMHRMLRLPRLRQWHLQSAAPATIPRASKRPGPRARQHPSPLDSCQMLPLPRKHTLRCTECCACHDFGNGISKVLRLPRFRAPRAARATTSQPFRQPPNAAPATQTHAQMHRMLRLPRLRQRHLQNAAPATISRAPSRARDNIPSL